jgi:poly-gamma-glutamate synthesis protein (capsule biosynthesis protein)
MKRVPRLQLVVLVTGDLVFVMGAACLGWWRWQLDDLAVATPGPVPVAKVSPPEPVASAPVAYDAAAWTAFEERLRGCETEAPLTTVAFVGDLMLSRSVGADLKASGDYDAPFAAFAPWLRSADLAFGNLETAITPGREIKPQEMMFRADAPVAAAMAWAGFDVVSLANNHTPNFGSTGLMDTFKVLKDAGVRYVGAGRDDFEAYQPAYLQANGLTFAFIAESDSDLAPKSYGATAQHPGTALFDLAKLKAAIAEARGVADVVIFSMHSGREYTPTPSGRQRLFAHAAIDAGADLVIGHHAHVVQEMEVYGGKPIFYGLGNFIFDQTGFKDTQDALAVRAEWRGRTLERLELEPLRLDAKYRPDFANPEVAKRVLARLAYGVTTEQAWRWNDLERRLKPTERAAIVLGSASACVKREGTWPLGAASLQLKDGRLSLTADGASAWTSPQEIWVEALAVASTAGRSAATVAYWQPAADSPQMHFGSLTWHDGRAAWEPDPQPLRAPVCALALADLDGGDEPEIITLLGDYAETPACQGREAVVFRRAQGTYDELASFAHGAFNGLTIGEQQGHKYFQPHLTP